MLYTAVLLKLVTAAKFSMINNNGIPKVPLTAVVVSQNLESYDMDLGLLIELITICRISFLKYRRAAVPEPRCKNKDEENASDGLLPNSTMLVAATSPSELKGSHSDIP